MRILNFVLLETVAFGVLASEQNTSLPAEECVRLQREARIARLREDSVTELEKLEAAHRDCPGVITPIYALLKYYRQQPELEEKYQAFVSLLTQQLQDPDDELPVGVVEYLIRDREIGDVELRSILDRVNRELTEPVEQEPAWIRIRAQLEQRLGETAAAAASLERLAQLQGTDEVFIPLLALYSQLERWQDAAGLIAPRVEEDRFLRRQYIYVLGKLGRYDEVLEQVHRLTMDTKPAAAADAGPKLEAILATLDFEVDTALLGLLKQVAWDLRDKGQSARAEEVFRSLLTRIPEDVELQTTVLHLYASAEERQTQAETLADSWQDETDPNALFEEGTQRLTSGDAAGAIDLLRRAAPEFPDLEAAWYNLGMAAYRLEDWPTVESAFGRAAEIQPDRAQSFFFRGLALEKLDRCDEAVNALQQALDLDPDRALAHYYLATCYRKLGDVSAAAEASRRYQATQKN